MMDKLVYSQVLITCTTINVISIISMLSIMIGSTLGFNYSLWRLAASVRIQFPFSAGCFLFLKRFFPLSVR